MEPQPKAVIERLHAAQNQHDLEAFLDCFAPDYQSEQPIHPDRVFQGSDQVRKNWSAIFSGVPDFHSELLHSAVEGNTVWTEWHWYGTRADGTRLDMRGVTLFGVQAGRIVWGRLYMEPTQETGAGIDAHARNLAQGSQQAR